MNIRVPRHAATIAALLFFALPAAAQKTTVSGTIIDPKGMPYSFSSVTAQLVPQNVSPTIGNPPLQFSPFNGPISTDIDGNWNMDLFSNTSISPGGTKWRFTICIAGTSVTGYESLSVQPPIGFGNQCFTPPDITVTGSTQNLDSLINPYAPVLYRLPYTNVYINHSFIGREVGIDFIPGSGVTLSGTDVPSQFKTTVQINASGGGTGCTLPGTDTGVLSEHPAGTCYDTNHWTWDDRASKQVMLIGDGTNTATTAQEAFIFGTANATTGSGLCCGDFVFLFGNGNTNALGTDAVALGFSNTITSSSSIYIVGEDNAADHANNNVVIGFDNNLTPATPNTLQNINDTFVIGQDNTLQSLTGSSGIKETAVIGFSNQITNLSTTGGSSQELQSVFVAGEQNTITQSATAGNFIEFVHIMGLLNEVTSTLGTTQEVDIVGKGNAVDGSKSTVQIIGAYNTAHQVSDQLTTTVNQTIAGSDNLVENTGALGVTAFEEVFGHQIHQHNCSNCITLGSNIDQSTSNQLAIGMATTPALLVDINGSGDNIRRTPHTFAYYPACAAGTEGSFAAITDSSTATWGATITGGSTNHVFGYCDGTNWTVAGK